MRLRAAAAALTLLLLGAPASAGARGGGLSVWPARLALAAGEGAELHVANDTGRRLALTARVAGLALDVWGAPRITARPGAAPLVLRRSALVVPPRSTVAVRVRARLTPGARAGDHPGLVLLTATGAGGAGVGVRVRIGVPVEVRAPGVIRRRLELGRLRRSGRRLQLVVRNRGDVVERLTRGSVVVELHRRGRVVAVLQPRVRDLLPRSVGLVVFRLPAGLHGASTVRAVVRAPARRARSFHVIL